MKTTLNVFIAIAIALVLTGLNACKKDATTTVSGRVTDATTGVAVPNATVYIQRWNTSCFSCNAGAFASVKADVKGNFVYSFEADKDFAYSIAAEANNYFSNKPSGGIGIDSYKKNSLLVPLQPIAWLKLHVKNTTPFDGNDVFEITPWGYPIDFFGMTVDTTFTGPVNGNASIPIYWAVNKNAVVKNYSGSTYCPAFDTTLYDINY